MAADITSLARGDEGYTVTLRAVTPGTLARGTRLSASILGARPGRWAYEPEHGSCREWSRILVGYESSGGETFRPTAACRTAASTLGIDMVYYGIRAGMEYDFVSRQGPTSARSEWTFGGRPASYRSMRTAIW